MLLMINNSDRINNIDIKLSKSIMLFEIKINIIQTRDNNNSIVDRMIIFGMWILVYWFNIKSYNKIKSLLYWFILVSNSAIPLIKGKPILLQFYHFEV